MGTCIDRKKPRSKSQTVRATQPKVHTNVLCTPIASQRSFLVMQSSVKKLLQYAGKLLQNHLSEFAGSESPEREVHYPLLVRKAHLFRVRLHTTGQSMMLVRRIFRVWSASILCSRRQYLLTHAHGVCMHTMQCISAINDGRLRAGQGAASRRWWRNG